jgi:hypothetical protein
LARSDFKVRGEATFFTVVGLSLAEDVPRFAAGRVSDYDKVSGEQAVTNDATFVVVFAHVVDLNCGAFKCMSGILEVQPMLARRPYY